MGAAPQLKFKEYHEPEGVGWGTLWTVVDVGPGQYETREVQAYAVKDGWVVRIGCFRMYVSTGTLHTTQYAAERRAELLTLTDRYNR